MALSPLFHVSFVYLYYDRARQIRLLFSGMKGFCFQITICNTKIDTKQENQKFGQIGHKGFAWDMSNISVTARNVQTMDLTPALLSSIKSGALRNNAFYIWRRRFTLS